MKVFDLTYDIKSNMVHFKGDPIPLIKNVKNIEKDGYNVKEIYMGTHTSTHVDAPSHFIVGGKSVEMLNPLSYSGIVQIVDASDVDFIDEEIVRKVSIERVFFYTGSNTNWDHMLEFEKFSFITESAAKILVKKGVKLVGIDSPSVEDPSNHEFAAHKILLGNETLIIENLNSIELKKIAGKVMFVIALPLRILNGDGSPARVIAIDWDDVK
ncbi:MAG: cyclase family protein [Thermoplasmata archaeon]